MNSARPTELAATRIFTDDVDGMIAFYEQVTGVAGNRIHPLFGEIATPAGTLAIASTQTAHLLGEDSATAAANRSTCLDFLVADVDAEHSRLSAVVTDFVNTPTTMPWGNRSLVFRDPDGNLVNVFTPVTPAARERFGLD